MSDTAAPVEEFGVEESKTSNKEQSFLARLVDFGDEIIPAERPAFEDLAKVLGALIHWIDQDGGFTPPESFNPAVSEAIAEQEAEQSRLVAQNAELSTRLTSLETLMRQQIAASAPTAPVPAEPAGVVTAAPVASPEAPAPVAAAPAPVVPGFTVAPPEAAPPAPAPVAPVPPVSE